jgi:hypothetical protein
VTTTSRLSVRSRTRTRSRPSPAAGTDDGHRRGLVTARLVHEDENPRDDHAVRVDVNGRTVAYLTRASARIYRRWLARQGHAGRTTTCIVGGWDRVPRGQGHFGVKLDLPSLY